MTSRLVALAVILAPGVLMLPVWRLRGLGPDEDDILYYLPSRTFFAESIRAGELPQINPWTGLGRPFLADPQSAVWYPFTWLFAVLPPMWAYPAVLWMHYSLAGWGMYRLLRAHRLNPAAAILGGMAFAFSGFMLAHRVHFTMQNAAAWAPWVLWRIARYADAGGPTRLLGAALAILMQCLAGHTQIAALTAAASAVFLLSRRGLRFQPLARGALCWLAAAGLFAIQWVPTLGYVQVCTRTRNTYWDFTQNSWWPISAITWLAPMLLGQRTPNLFDDTWWGPSHQCEQFAYAGIIPLMLAAIAVRAGWRTDPGRRAFFWLAVLGLATALGKYGPVCPLLYLLPGSEVFRAPARALLLFNLAVAALAAFTFHDLTSPLSPDRVRWRAVAKRLTRRPLCLAATILGVCVAATAAALPLADVPTRTAVRRALLDWDPLNWELVIPFAVVLASLYSLRRLAADWQTRRPLALVFAILVIDLGIIGWHIDVPYGRSVTDLAAPPQREAWLKHVRGSPHRIWVATDTEGIYTRPAEKLVANTNALEHVASLTDYGPLQPTTFRDRFRFAPWGDCEIAEQLLADTSWMRPFNVGWVLLCEPHWPPPAGCELVFNGAGKRLYRSYMASGDVLVEPAGSAFEIIHAKPAQFVIHVGAPDESTSSRNYRVTFSRLALPGWTGYLGRGPVPARSTAEGLMQIDIPAGSSALVSLVYDDRRLDIGAVITAITFLALLVGPFLSLVRRRMPGQSKMDKAFGGSM